jgi:hypothetical protein
LTADEYLPPRPAQTGDANGKPHRPPPSPIIAALDANHDGVISADEIAQASAALKTLDQNGNGQLTPDEYRPPRPPLMQNGDAANGDQPAPPDDAPAGPPPGE